MNKTLFLLLIPCIIGFISAQYGYSGYGAGGYYGVGSQLPYGGFYAGYGLQNRRNDNSDLLIGGLLFFAFILLTNLTGSISG